MRRPRATPVLPINFAKRKLEGIYLRRSAARIGGISLYVWAECAMSGGFHSDQGARQRIFLRASGDFLLRLRIPAAKKMADPPSSSDQEGPLFRGASEPVWLNFYECLKLVAVIFREGCSRIGAMSGFLWDSGSTCLGSVADSGGRFVGRLAKAVMKCVDGQFEFV